VWLATDFEGGRHQRRLDKIAAIEREIGRGSPPSPGGGDKGTSTG